METLGSTSWFLGSLPLVACSNTLSGPQILSHKTVDPMIKDLFLDHLCYKKRSLVCHYVMWDHIQEIKHYINPWTTVQAEALQEERQTRIQSVYSYENKPLSFSG